MLMRLKTLAIAAASVTASFIPGPIKNDSVNERVLKVLEDARGEFLSGKAKSVSGPIKVHYQAISEKQYTVFGIEKSRLSPLAIETARPHILKAMGFAENTAALQVIGDSAPFGHAQSCYAAAFLEKLLHEHAKHVILYGLTGTEAVDNMGRICVDANQLINRWIAIDSKLRSQRVLANVVDLHTPMAIRQWDCQIGEVRQLFLVYTQGKPEAKFGDDVIASDYFMANTVAATDKAACSIAVCLEGGVQSFNQVITMLNLGIAVHALENLRGAENPSCFDQATRCYIPYFSAAEFLSLIKKHIASKSDLTEDDMVKLKNQYLYDPSIHGSVYDPSSGLRVLSNPRKPDYSTKSALFAAAWQQFIDNRSWLKLDLLQLYCYKPIESQITPDKLSMFESGKCSQLTNEAISTPSA